MEWSLKEPRGATLGGRTQGRKGRVTTSDAPRPSPHPSASAQLPASPGWPGALSWSQHRSVTSYQSHGFSKHKVTTTEHFRVTKKTLPSHRLTTHAAEHESHSDVCTA